MQVEAGTVQKKLERDELTSARPGLAAAAKRLSQRRVAHRQDKILEGATTTFVDLACRWRP
jgi:hypothetical protein